MVTTNFPNGITNASDTESLGTLNQLDPTKNHIYFNDFNTFDPSHWDITVVEAGSGSATQALVDEVGGALEILNDDAIDDSTHMRIKNNIFKLTKGKRLHFEVRLKIFNGQQTELVAGLYPVNENAFNPNNGIFFKVGSASNLSFNINNNGESEKFSMITNLLSDTYVKLTFVYDGRSQIQFWVNDGEETGTLSSDKLPDDEELTVSYFARNKGVAVAQSMTIDYVSIVNQR